VNAVTCGPTWRDIRDLVALVALVLVGVVGLCAILSRTAWVS
jgi:hypothetical protein